jgi:hypothetical protein
VQQFQYSWHHANAEIYWLDERIGVHIWMKLTNKRLYMKETIYHNKERKIGNTKYLNQTSWNLRMEHDEKQPDNGTAVNNLVCS